MKKKERKRDIEEQNGEFRGRRWDVVWVGDSVLQVELIRLLVDLQAVIAVALLDAQTNALALGIKSRVEGIGERSTQLPVAGRLTAADTRSTAVAISINGTDPVLGRELDNVVLERQLKRGQLLGLRALNAVGLCGLIELEAVLLLEQIG